MKYFDLSNAQKMILFSSILNPNNSAFYLNFKKEYQVSELHYLKKAINIICGSYLNLQLKNCGDDFKQYYIEDNGEDKFEFIDLTGMDDENLEDYIKEFLNDPFEDLFDKSLYKIEIIKTTNSLILVGVFQHILVDGTSLFSIFPHEISKCMDALKNSREYKKVSNLNYETYVNREKEYLNSPEFVEDKKYWLDNLEDYKQDWYSFENLDLGTYEIKFDEELTNALMKLSNINGTRISPFVLALSVVSLYFAKSKSLNNIVWNTSISGRYFGEDISQLLGMFTNTIPLKMVYDENLSFEDLLLSTKDVLKQGLTHGKIQFNEYSSDLRNSGVDPGVITMYSIVSNSTDYETDFMTLQKDTEFPFHIRVNKNYSDKKGLQSLFIEYNRNCFSPKQVKEIAEGIELLLYSISVDSTKSCKDYDVEVNEFFKAETYFKELINSFDNPTIISPDVYGKKDESQFNLKRLRFDKEQVNKIEYYVNSCDLSIKEFLYGVLMFNLTKYSFSKDILVSTSSFRNILGNKYLNDFNELAIAYNFNTNKNVIEYLTDFKFRLNEIFNYSFYPLNNNNSLSFDSEILFNYFDDSLPEFEYNNIDYFNSLISEDIDLDKFNLIFSIVNDEDCLRLNIGYDSSLYSDELINSFMESTDLLIDKFIQNDKKVLKNISIAKNKDTEFNIELVNEAVINKIFEEKVEKNPNKTILYGTDGELTYSQLNKKANRIANALLTKGVEVEDKIMILMERNTDLIASVLGVVKAGATFIPVDPNYPQERVNQILTDSNSKFIIISDNVDYNNSNTINVNELLECREDTNPTVDLTPDNLCFIIYTSGSTGKPKGVMITHKGISNYAVNHPLNIPIYALNNKCTKMISISTVSFIVFLREIFATILNGLPVVFANEEEAINPLKLADLFHKTNADAFGSTPTRLLEYLKFPEIQEVISKCKCIIIGGEGFPPRLYDELRKYTNSEIYNSYGPTEVTIASHGKLVESNNITAGYPMLNVTDKVMDIDANELPPYVTGEIYVGGAGIARGYYNNQELTNKVFMQINNIPFYNTGDLGKKDDKNELYVLGRNDTQIKLRGLRIELSEIEGNIAKYENINSAAVIVKEIKSTEYLCAYYTKKDPNKEIDKESLRTYLQKQLPDYMVPHYLQELDKFPATPNGKTDFKNLPIPNIEKNEQEYTPPKTETEKQLTNIVQKILEIDKISVNTDLFTIGLTSLTVIKLSSTIFEELKSELNVIDIINAKTIRKIGKLIESNQTKNITEEESNYKLTPNQLGIYFECVKNPEKVGYNLPKKIIFDNTINPTQLKESIIKAINKHSYLKNRIIIEDGEVFNAPYGGEINEIEIEEIQELNTEILNNFIKPFDIINNQLFRFKIYTTPTNTILLADFHHIIVDGTSLNILFKDIAAIYDKKELTPTKADAYDYIRNENNFNNSEKAKESEKFFDEMMVDFDEGTILTTNLNDDEDKAKIANIKTQIDKKIVDNFCKNQKFSQNILFMSATALTLTKYVSNKDILISTIFNGRNNPKYQNTIGMLVKTIPIAFKTDRNMNIAEYFEFINKSWLNVLNYSSFNYVEIANKYDLYPDFLYAYHGKIIEDIKINGKTYPRESIEYDSLRYKISINIIEEKGNYNISIDYNDALYTKEYIKTFTNSIKTVISTFINTKKEISTIKIKDIELIPEHEKPEFIKTDTNILQELFEQIVSQNPNKTAIIASDTTLTYDQLNKKANRVAHALINRGIKPGSKILHMMPRTSDLIVAMFAIIKTGSAFIPLANDYPEERVEYIFKNSEADYVISNLDLKNAITIETLLEESNDETNPKPKITGDDLAYMIYTSGSTGNPKGVMVTNENITNLFAHTESNYIYNFYKKMEKMLSITTVSFDASLHELIGCFVNGKTLIFADDTQTKDIFELVNLIKNTKPDYMASTPSRLLQYAEFDGFREILHYFKVVSVGGEKLPKKLVEIFSKYNVNIYNSYGPTETTVRSNLKHIEPNKPITIGKALFNYITDVRDLDGKLLPDGVMGELYIGGKGVSKGYYNNPEKTKESYTKINGINYYRSGDYAIKIDDDFYIQGRMDNQIKLRGLRIEPEEISFVISTYPNITKAIVIISKINGVDHLCTYYTANEKINIEDLKTHISSKLTDYMVPTVFMQLEEIPQTPNGKTDLKKLPEPEISTEYVAPENEVEAFFANIFKDILELNKVGVTDNFFEIGGNSLLVTKITIEAINNGYNINYGNVFDNPTPRELAQFILSDNETSTENKEEKYDYTVINHLLQKNNIDSFINGEPDESLGNILLTGATGFLGIHLLKELIENETGDIYCLVRSKGMLTAKKRLQSLLFYYFAKDFEEQFDNRLHIIEGDITNYKDFKKLKPFPIDSIINSAANVKHFSSGTDIEDINLGGVINGLKFAKTKNAKFIQISTVSVAGESVNNYPPADKIFTEQDLYIGQRVDNQYLNSKFLAERYVLEAAAKDNLNVKIMRVGNLMARSSDSEFQINFNSNGFVNRLKSFVTLGKFPYLMLNNNVEFSQIDITAKSIVKLSKTPKECLIFHPYNNHKISFSDIIDILKELDLDIDVVGEEEYENSLNEVMKDESKQEGLSGFITSIGSGQVKKVWVKDENNYTMQVSYLLGVKWPLISEEYIYMFIKYLKDLNFFN